MNKFEAWLKKPLTFGERKLILNVTISTFIFFTGFALVTLFLILTR